MPVYAPAFTSTHPMRDVQAELAGLLVPGIIWT